MTAREIPSNILREALLAYSKERKRSRSRNRDHHDSSEGIGCIQGTQHHKNQLNIQPNSEEKPRNIDNIESLQNTSLTDKMTRFETADLEDMNIINELHQQNIGDVPITRLLQLDGENNENKGGIVKDEPAVAAGAYPGSALYFRKEEVTPSASLQYTSTAKERSCISRCCTTTKYHVPPELKDGDRPAQTTFIQKVFMILFLKAFIMLGWLKTVEFIDEVRIHYEEQFQYHYISGATYIIIKLIIRITKNFRDRQSSLYIILHIFEIIAASDFLASIVTYWLDSHFNVPRRVLYCIAGTFLFFICVGAFVTYDMQDGIMMGTAFIITAIIAVHQFIHSKSAMGLELVKFHTSSGIDEIVASLTVLGVAELIMTIIMFELRSVLTGQRYSLSSKDWFFTAVYVI